MADNLEELVAEITAVTREAGQLADKLGRLASAARRLGAHPLGEALLQMAESAAYGVPGAIGAAALRIEQGRRGKAVSPVSVGLAAGRCPSCLGLPTSIHPHAAWCPGASPALNLRGPLESGPKGGSSHG